MRFFQNRDSKGGNARVTRAPQAQRAEEPGAR